MDTRIKSLIDDLMVEAKKVGLEISNLIIFGSQSDGTATAESDVDIAIISPSFHELNSLQRRKRIKPILYHLIDQYKLPIDLILLTPEEYSEESSIRMSFIRSGVNVPVSV